MFNFLPQKASTHNKSIVPLKYERSMARNLYLNKTRDRLPAKARDKF